MDGDLIKANPNRDEKGRYTFGAHDVDGDYSAWLPPSDWIKTRADAEKYYKQHISGIWSLVISRKGGLRRVRVNMRDNDWHAYTKEVGGRRVFWPERARRLSAILDNIVNPGIVLMNGDKDLFVEKVRSGDHDVVVLQWEAGKQEYRFRSHHYWPHDEFKRRTADTRRGGYALAPLRGKPASKNATPEQLEKSSGVPAAFPVLHLTRSEDSCEYGDAHAGSGWRLDGSMAYVADLFKAESEIVFRDGIGVWEVMRDPPPQAFPCVHDILSFGGGEPAVVESIDGDTVQVSVLGKALWFDWQALEIDRVSHMDGRALWILKALEAGERWITVHPNGDGSTGVPVLVREHPDGTASVIGGAGGKLNHLKLRGIKPQSEYKQALKEKAAARSEEHRKRIAEEKASGVFEERETVRKQVREAVHKERADFVRGVAELAGWEDWEFDEAKHSGLSPEALDKARADHSKSLFKRATETVDLNRKRLIADADADADADARIAAGLGEMPMQTDDAEIISVADLEPMKEVSGAKLGFDAHYQQRAGVTKEAIRAEAEDMLAPQDDAGNPVKPDAETEQAQAEAKAEKSDLRTRLEQELDQFRLDNPDVKPPSPKVLLDAQKAAQLLKLQKRLKLIEGQAKQAGKNVDSAPIHETKAFVVEVSDSEVEDAARKQMEDDLRTERGRSFLSALDQSERYGRLAARGERRDSVWILPGRVVRRGARGINRDIPPSSSSFGWNVFGFAGANPAG
ncbi:MAG TPA: hypothetical protein VI457_03895 [Methylococcaceae bacterium]|nr:hypothetical protein [Methylococcaceae bacterium]